MKCTEDEIKQKYDEYRNIRLEEIKNHPQTKHIPVHIMSSHKLRQESLLQGAVDFLHKPVAFDRIPEVFTRIEHIISKESQKVLII